MNAPISDTFARQLKEQRGALLARVRQQRGGAIGRAEAAAEARSQESDDWGKATEERDLLIGLEERDSAELVALDAALQRIADGSYGLCLQCGASIPAARLHAQPTAERCVGCQDAQEKHGH